MIDLKISSLMMSTLKVIEMQILFVYEFSEQNVVKDEVNSILTFELDE